MSENIDAVCLIHGKKHSEHDCLFCGLCFKPLTVEECAYLPNGKREDVCIECAMAEHERLPLEFQTKNNQLTALEAKVKRLEEALRPFAACAEPGTTDYYIHHSRDCMKDGCEIDPSDKFPSITAGDLRKAAVALEGE